MNGDNEKEKEVKSSGDENSQTNTNKSEDKKTVEHDTKEKALDILEDMPPEIKKRFLSISMGSISRSILSPFESKINEKHIDKIIELGEKDNERMYKDTQHSRKFRLIYFLIGVALFVFLTLFLVGKDTELFKEVIKLFVVFVGGMGAGYGIKHYVDNK
jgi:hypothetical protein